MLHTYIVIVQTAGFLNLAFKAKRGEKAAMNAPVHRRFLPKMLCLLMLALAAIVLARPALADDGDVAAAARGVVRVVIVGRDGDEIFPVSHGTGFSVGGERIVTNAHVIQQALEDKRLSIGIVPPEGGDAVYARPVSVSPRNDLALLQTTQPMNLPPLTIAGNPAGGQAAVTAIGYPMNVDRAQGLGSNDIFRATPPVTSTGFLSGRRPSREFDTLLHTAPIARGNSGGPLVDDCGRLLGVNSFGAESEGTEAEFFFAVSTRELLPFLRANDVQPRLNSLPCRSIAELDAAEYERNEREAEAEEERAAAEEAALAQRTETMRRDLTYAVFESRSNKMAIALLALVIAMAAGSTAVFAHMRKDMQLRAIAGSVAVLALLGAITAWLARPAFADIETQLEEAIRAEMDETPPALATIPVSEGPAQLACVLDQDRSRVISAPEQDITIVWRENGCINNRTQYALAAGDWLRVFVPATEAAVSVNRFDPETREFVMERYLLDREAMTNARAARGEYQAPQCDANPDAARDLSINQGTILTALPSQPNERLVYTCTEVPTGLE